MSLNSGRLEPFFQASGNRGRKVKRNRDLESVQDSQTERERVLSDRRDIHDFVEKKADHVFQGECTVELTQDYLQRRLNWTQENRE